MSAEICGLGSIAGMYKEYRVLKEIPFSPNFLASHDGRIYDINGNERNQYRNADGYCTCAILDQFGRWVTYGVHRLVALAFIEPFDDPYLLAVNHLDLDKENNAVSNLEWVTAKSNNAHAALSLPSARPTVLAWNGDPSESILTDSLNTAAAIAGCDAREVWNCILNNSMVNGWQFRHQRSKDPIPEHLRKSPIPRRESITGRIPTSPVKMKNIFTGEIEVYSSMTEASSAHGVLTGHLSQVARSPSLCTFRGTYLVAYAAEDFFEADMNELRKAALRGVGREVTVVDISSGESATYPSASRFITDSGLSKKAVTVRLKRDAGLNTPSTYNGYKFAYSDLNLI